MTKRAVFAALLLLLPAVSARAEGRVTQYQKFSTSSETAGGYGLEGLELSSGAARTERGLEELGSRPESEPLWAQLPVLSLTGGSSMTATTSINGDDRPRRVWFVLTLKGAFADAEAFPRRLSARCSADGTRWGGWQGFSLDVSSRPTVYRYLEAELSVPEKGEVPFIGHVQLRLEGPRRPKKPSVLQSMLLKAGWD